MNIKREANLRERKQAKDLDMIRSPYSGAKEWKGDIRNEFFLIDSKYTYNKSSISIKKRDIDKIDEEAFNCSISKRPALLISIDGLERMVITMESFKEYNELLIKESDDGK